MLKVQDGSGIQCRYNSEPLFRRLNHRDFPSWHFAMLNDRRRNEAIEKSISELDLAGKTVVEIGAGTGLIALLFAKYGADRVVTCEQNANLAHIAREVISSTPYSERIELVEMNSRDAIDNGLLPQAPDVIFTETLDCGVVGEAYFAIACDIRALAGKNTIILPTRIHQVGQVVDSVDIDELNTVDDVCGFDLSVLNAFSTATYFPVRSELYDLRALTPPQVVRSYDYRKPVDGHRVELTVARSGRARGLITWMEIEFGNHLFHNAPGTRSHWHQAYHPLSDALQVVSGQTLEISIADDGRAASRMVRGIRRAGSVVA